MATTTGRPALLNALLRPYPESIAGDPISWSYDSPSGAFTLRYSPDRSLAAPTEIVLPSRLYPGGYGVDCGGCVTTRTGSGVAVFAPTAGDPLTVTIHPR